MDLYTSDESYFVDNTYNFPQLPVNDISIDWIFSTFNLIYQSNRYSGSFAFSSIMLGFKPRDGVTETESAKAVPMAHIYAWSIVAVLVESANRLYQQSNSLEWVMYLKQWRKFFPIEKYMKMCRDLWKIVMYYFKNLRNISFMKPILPMLSLVCPKIDRYLYPEVKNKGWLGQSSSSRIQYGFPIFVSTKVPNSLPNVFKFPVMAPTKDKNGFYIYFNKAIIIINDIFS